MSNMTLDKAEKLTFWINEWGADYLKNESSFPYLDLLRYDRGCAVEANLGFKIGSEQGGLHYCIVLDHKNAKSNKVLMVVPLESLPNNQKPESIDENYEVFLGYGIFKDDIKKIESSIIDISSKIEVRKSNGLEFSRLENTLSKLEKELTKLQKGSVAQIGQICALSKMRIYNPRGMGDKFSTFKLDDDKMKEIEDKIAYLYFKRFLEKSNITSCHDIYPEFCSKNMIKSSVSPAFMRTTELYFLVYLCCIFRPYLWYCNIFLIWDVDIILFPRSMPKTLSNDCKISFL
ncbi:type II toxin-antitoxin system PemK/MazF family toxin [Desulfosporosinus sp. I2]|uniref:type II toxin-antitoxin system PemK/MazF family toxin n=1 Tax=Desulfosporosinus sp. I2 TaxID=1617025 RepID=UPI0005ED7303|nr:type II toxin-antitoxin system PemK/MazF family toxin [Desulfosporosinus sp. I2]